MKIIGMAENEYIATLSHTEIEKFLGLYYDKLKRLEVGVTVDLGRAYDYSVDFKSALSETKHFISKNRAVINAIINGLNIERLSDEAAKE